jgi:hypothetical protein
MAGQNQPRRITVFNLMFGIPSIQSDLPLWDRVWEKTLRKISASKDVYPPLSELWKRDNPSNTISAAELSKRVCKVQALVLGLENLLEEPGDFATTWVLLNEAERKRLLLKGLKDACDQASLKQDGRALCPEITTSAMLRQNGKAFIDFVRNLVKGMRDVDEGEMYLLPSEWWQSAVDTPAEPWSEDAKFAFRQLSIQRNEFISEFSQALCATLTLSCI